MKAFVLFFGSLLVCLAASAPVALASPSEFGAADGTVTGPIATKGAAGTAGHMEVVLPPFTLKCTKTRSKGSVEDHGSTLADDISLSGCTTAARFGQQEVPVAAKFDSALELEYSASSPEVDILSAVTIDVKAIKCLIHIQPGETWNEAEGLQLGSPYGNELSSTTKLGQFPSGFQKKLAIHNEDDEMAYGFAGSCAGLPAGDEGTLSGVLSDEVAKGDLEWVPGEGGNEVPGGWNKVKNVKDPEVPGT